MARILFAWEFGTSEEELIKFLPLAIRLRGRGHQPVFALSDVTRAEAALGRCGFEYLQAPVWHPRQPRPSVIPCSYSEILQHYGYLDPEGLLGMVKGWREIYRLIEPQVVLFENAPTALLASRGFEAARVICGVGFCSPPRVTPFPNFRTWQEVPAPRLETSDARVLDTVNAVLRRLSLRPLAALHELFDVDDEFLCTFSELDHYATRGSVRYCGPVFARNEGAQAVWPDGGEKRVFVSLRPGMRAFHTLAQALSDSGHSVVWFAPGVSDETVGRYQKRTLTFSREPVRLADVAQHAHAAVLSGSHGTVSAMLLAGVPMALYPMHIEQALVTRAVERIGAAAAAPPDAAVPDLRNSLAAILNHREYAERAAAFAAKYQHFDPKNVVARIARRVEAHCGQRAQSV